MNDAANSRLTALSQYNILDTPPEPEFDDIVQIAQRVCDTPVALVSFVARDRQWFKARVGFDACETPIGQSVCAYALGGDGVMVIPDLMLDPRTRDNALVTGEPHIRFYAGAPLKTPDGTGIGSLCVIDDKPRPEGLTAAQTATLQALARQTMVVMDLRNAMEARDAALASEQQASRRSLERARASEAASDRFRDAEALVREAQEAARVGAFEVDIATDRFTASAEFCRIFGVAAQDSFAASEFEDLILLQDRVVASSRTTRTDATTAPDVEYRIRRRSDGALRWVSRRSSFTWDKDGRPVRMLGVIQDVTERKLVELRASAMITLGDRLRAAPTTRIAARMASDLLGETLVVTRSGYATIDGAAELYTVEHDWTSPGAASLAGTWPTDPVKTTIGRLGDGVPLTIPNIPAAAWLGADLDAYAALGVRALIKVPLVQDGALAGVLFVHDKSPRTWSVGEIEFAVAVADRTYAAIAKLQAEAHQRVLNEELSHRLKNTLSMVQAIVAQTLRKVVEREVVKSLENRIIALSKAHDVLLQQSWTSASIGSVIASVLELHGRSKAIRRSGPELTMGPKATLSLSLLLHELTTNSIKYGALSVETGRVDFGWRIEQGNEPMLVLDWIEVGGPPVVAPSRRGFGSRLIGMGLAGTGDAKLDYDPEGLRAKFRAPLRSVRSL